MPAITLNTADPIAVLLLMGTFLLAFAYVSVIRYSLARWRSLRPWDIPAGFVPCTQVSVLVPARNEAPGILACMDALSRLRYPVHLLEIIFIDDHSTDQTPDLITGKLFEGSRLVSLAGFPGRSGKKAALETGLAQARGELIVTTDADCLVPPDWLRYLVSYYEIHRPKFIAAPVCFYGEQNPLQRFQSLDLLGMMILTGAGVSSGHLLLANGANMAFPAQVFRKVGGYDGLRHLASGDDMLLLHRIAARYPGRLAFLKNAAAAVRTVPPATLRGFWSQRLRWAGKSAHYREWRLLLVIGLVFVYAWVVLLGLLLGPVLGPGILLVAFFLLACKTAADFVFLNTAARFFGRIDLMRSFLPAQLIHLLYFALVGLAGIFVKSYSWKGRRVR